MISAPNPNTPSPLVLDINIVDETPSEAWRIDDHLRPSLEDSTWIDEPSDPLDPLEETALEAAFYGQGPAPSLPAVAAWSEPEPVEGHLFLVAAAVAIFGLCAGIALALLS